MTDPTEPTEPVEPTEPIESDELPEGGELDGDATPEASGRARRAAIVALRIVRGTVAVWVAVGVILIVGLVPLPTVAKEAPTVEVTPAPADQVRLCGGAFLRLGDASGQDAGTAAAIGAPSVRADAIGGPVRYSQLGASDAGTGGTSAAPTLLTLAPAPDASLSGAQSQVVDQDGFAGFTATGCAEPSGSSWLVGGATTVGRTTLLTLGNPTAVDATVSLELYGEAGRVTAPGMSGIHVGAGSQRVLALAGFAPDLASPVVHVIARGGRVVAELQQSTTRVLDPGGVDVVGETAVPAREQVIPGVRVLDAIGVSRTLGREDSADLAPVIRLAAPGDADATVTVSVVPEDPTLTGASFEIGVGAGSVVDVPLDSGADTEGSDVALADGMYTVTVDSDEPVVAGVRVSTAQPPVVAPDASPFAPPPPPVTDFAWIVAAPELQGDTLVTVAQGPEPRLTVVNPGSSPLQVQLEAQGGADLSLTVPANGSASIAVDPGVGYLLKGVDGARASVSFATVGRLAGYVVVSPRPGSGPIVIVP